MHVCFAKNVPPTLSFWNIAFYSLVIAVATYCNATNQCVVVIVCNYISVFIGYCNYIVLNILYIVIFFAVINETESVAFVIPQRQNLSGVLPKSLETWNYPSGCLLSQKALRAGISYLRTV